MKVRLYTVVCCFIFLVSCQKKQNDEISVTAVYPSSDVLPENLLRLYIQFSKPMKTIGNLEHIKLINSEGEDIKGAIFNNTHELWDKEQKQLTIIFDPSRVKTGLVANKALGRALESSKTYQLVISDVEDIYHQKLEKPFIKEFSVIKADTIAPDIEHWNVNLPLRNSKNDLIVQFPEMLDFNSLSQRLIITNSKKEIIKGNVSVEQKETVWKFKPIVPWKKGDHFLYINARLEDPSGNNLNGLFDHKIGSLKYHNEGETLHIPFTIQ